MAALAELTAAPDTDATPGYIVSPPTLRDYGAAERRFEAARLSRARFVSEGKPFAEARQIIADAEADVSGGKYAFGAVGFDEEMLRLKNAPFVLWLCLRREQPEVTEDAAAELLAGPDADALYNSALTECGYPQTNLKKNGTETKGEDARSTGDDLAAASPSEGSPTETSAA